MKTVACYNLRVFLCFCTTDDEILSYTKVIVICLVKILSTLSLSVVWYACARNSTEGRTVILFCVTVCMSMSVRSVFIG